MIDTSRLPAWWLGCDVAICLGELTCSADRRLDKALGARPLAQLFGCKPVLVPAEFTQSNLWRSHAPTTMSRALARYHKNKKRPNAVRQDGLRLVKLRKEQMSASWPLQP